MKWLIDLTNGNILIFVGAALWYWWMMNGQDMYQEFKEKRKKKK